MAFKIAFIGAGSIGFTRQLVRDILSVPEFHDIKIAFTDINERNLDMVTQLARGISMRRSRYRIQSTLDREALDTVYLQRESGDLDAFRLDIDSRSNTASTSVSETRSVPAALCMARGHTGHIDCKISEVAEPGCLLLNYSNPNAMMTWAANQYGGVNTIGLCHGVQHGHQMIAEVLGLKREEVDIICAGINHQTWYIQVKYKGQDMTGKLLEAFEKHPTYSKTEKVRIDMLRRFGYFSTESNGHLSEYVPWYRKRPEELIDWIDLGSWINGETGGYLRICTEERNWFETDFPNWMKQPPNEFRADRRGMEHGSYILEGLETGRVYRGHFNVVNSGCITNLPDDAIVEVPGYVDANGVSIPRVGDLPLGCAAVCNASISVQRLAVRAAVEGNDFLLRQAMMLDPLTGAVCNPPEIWQMVDEMLVAQEQWLPQYREAIAAAKERLAAGNLIPTKEGYQGAARLKVRSVEELVKKRKDATKEAAASDKA